MELRNTTILYFATVNWNHSWQRQQEFARQLSFDNEVIYFSPIGMFNYGLMVLRRKVMRRRKGASDKNVHKGKERTSGIKKRTLHFIPWHNNRVIDAFNTRWMTRQIHTIVSSGQKKTKLVFWTSNPSRTVMNLARTLEPEIVIYDNAMIFEKIAGANDFVIEHEKEAVSRADIVITDNDYNRQKYKNWRKASIKITQGVDLDLFDKEKVYKKPQVLEGVTSPIVGYYGSFQDVFDYDLMEQVIQALPQYHFLLIGPVKDENKLTSIRQFKNCTKLPAAPHNDLPRYLSFFDVAIIPYKVNEYTQGTFPTKMFEYLAMNKPVVAEPLAELQKFSDVVYLADEAEGFTKAIQEAAMNKLKDMEKVRTMVLENSWEAKIQKIKKAVHEYRE